MESKVNIVGHPLHPMLIVFPSALFPLLLFLDVLFWLYAADGLWLAGFWVAVAGLVMTALAAIPGYVDFFHIPKETSAKTIGWWHLSLGTLTLLTFAVAVWLRWPPGSGAEEFALATGIDVFGTILISVQGYLGGHLVYRKHIGVPTVEEGAEPTPFKGEPPSAGGGRGAARRRGAERP